MLNIYIEKSAHKRNKGKKSVEEDNAILMSFDFINIHVFTIHNAKPHLHKCFRSQRKNVYKQTEEYRKA